MAVPARVEDKRPFERVLQLLDRTVVRRPTTGEDWEDIFRLRYNAYRSRDYIDSNEEELDSDKFDNAENTHVFGFYVDDKLAMCFRVHLLNRDYPTGGPSAESYPEAILPRIALGQTFTDCSRFSMDPDLDPSIDRAALRFIPFRISAAASFYYGTNYILQLVRPRHKAFYRRYFMAETFAVGGDCDTVTFPVDLTATRMGVNDEEMLQRLPFLRSLKSEQAMLFDEETAQRCCYCVRSTAHLAIKRINDNRFGRAETEVAEAETAA